MKKKKKKKAKSGIPMCIFHQLNNPAWSSLKVNIVHGDNDEIIF